MKAIILAAGEGNRLKKYTKLLPKGMLEFLGKTLIERQIENFRRNGINDITIVKGFESQKINYPNIRYFTNEAYAETNMVASLVCAREILDDDVIICYSDIVIEDRLIHELVIFKDEIGALVDLDWKSYWEMRYGRVDFDTESLSIDFEADKISNIGISDPPIESIDARVVGLYKFSKSGIKKLLGIWDRDKDLFWDKPWQISGKPFQKAYMTDMLQALIDDGNHVRPVSIRKGWLEFDTNEDYEKAIEWHKKELLQQQITI